MALYLGNEKYNVNQYADGFEDGEKSALDEFWGTIQNYGQPKNFSSYFITAYAWNDSTFNPRFDFICTSAAMMFQYSKITKLAEKLKERNLKLDTSACSQVNQMFQGASIKDVPRLDITKAQYVSYMFGTNAKVETIEGLIFSKTTGSASSTNFFYQASKLTHCKFEGKIHINDLNLSDCVLLDKESLLSLLNCLAETETTKTVTLGATNLAKLTDEEKAIATEKGWDLA